MHACPYAEFIRKPVYYIENVHGEEVCGFCHAPKQEEQKALPKTVRK